MEINGSKKQCEKCLQVFGPRSFKYKSHECGPMRTNYNLAKKDQNFFCPIGPSCKTYKQVRDMYFHFIQKHNAREMEKWGYNLEYIKMMFKKDAKGTKNAKDETKPETEVRVSDKSVSPDKSVSHHTSVASHSSSSASKSDRKSKR